MRTTTRLSLCIFSAVLITGCDEPETDELRSEDGASPDPSGVIEGTVVYIGPRPPCRYEAGAPVEPLGRVVLLLFEHDNPPPPAGSASSAENLLVIPGSQLFDDLSDCLPEGEPPSAADAPITRSASFLWPEIELDADDERSFQIRGFYDSDGDFNPFFSVTNQPTRGDVGGGAFVDIRAPIPAYLPITFPSARDAPNGARNVEPTVTLGAVVSTTRPVSELDRDTMPLSSEARLSIEMDPARREQELWALTQAKLSMFPRTLGPQREAAFEAAGLDFDLEDPRAYAWYIRPLDVNGDGAVDPHPILGSAGVPWLSPAILMRRARSAAETAAGFPDVLLIPTPRPSAVALGRTVQYPSLDVIVAPIAAVVLSPEIPECRVPYVPPGNIAEIYRSSTAPIPTECHELPTGNYGIGVLHGFANARFQMVPEPVSPTEWIFCLTADCPVPSFTGQAWTIPNELGDPVQLGDETVTLPSQSVHGTFVVFDPSPETTGGGGSAECATSLEGTPIDTVPVPDACCAAVREKFCDIPLCDPIPATIGVGAAGQMIRGPGRDDDGDGELDCIPFAMPASCCD